MGNKSSLSPNVGCYLQLGGERTGLCFLAAHTSADRLLQMESNILENARDATVIFALKLSVSVSARVARPIPETFRHSDIESLRYSFQVSNFHSYSFNFHHLFPDGCIIGWAKLTFCTRLVPNFFECRCGFSLPHFSQNTYPSLSQVSTLDLNVFVLSKVQTRSN